MANSLGFYIVSPATFSVTWNGDLQTDATVDVTQITPGCIVDNHAAYGSFTVVPGFLPMTEQPGDFIFIKGMPNERCLPYSCMEGLIEAWWNPATFGLVYLLNQPGRFVIEKGQPIAQMFVYKASGAAADVYVIDGYPDAYRDWLEKRSRDAYRKDFDYLVGRHPNGQPAVSHAIQWKGPVAASEGAPHSRLWHRLKSFVNGP